MMFCLHLFMYGFHEMTEVSAIPFIDNFKWHMITEPFEGEPIGDMYSIAMLLFPWPGWPIPMAGTNISPRALCPKPQNKR